ncbi:TonB-dependent siderophore receptor [Sphingobacterium wenxiniae]|uniref:Iron complex outermembrane recepter protein n=1 Tax=Sphingobacterium wenxiniae TaxID=683125 RepID=A0A1I6UL60_9SPHI|nr:TonB-dependent siderophore receptor [Sphingobacterium wenxiniae]SFT02138.1 iron complex outermembrane recepter protein [Sphingobacterium wenxiniae]
MNKKLILPFIGLIAGTTYLQAQTTVKGRVLDEMRKPVAEISVRSGHKSVKTDENGYFQLYIDRPGRFPLRFSGVGFGQKEFVLRPEGSQTVVEDIILSNNGYNIENVEVFGERGKQPKGLEDITRMPLKPSDQIQSISVISHKVIEDQGALTLTDAVRNIPGVTLFGSYGGVKESMSTRGFRGVPVLKNGVRMDSQFQTASGVVDMQGVESIQMIKGSAAITQGVITDIGNAGGVINVVTKTPNFINAGTVGARVGSWGQFRPTFDVQTILDKKETLAIRFNGAYERADSYRKSVSSNSVYFNPSLTWKASDKTTITLEGDYLNSNKTPVTSAVNLNSSQGVNALYLLPNDRMAGLSSDNNNTTMSSFMATISHALTDHWRLRGAYAFSSYQTDNQSTGLSLLRANNPDFELFSRSMSRSLRDDKNRTVQFDLIGEDLYTGKIKHTVQAGFDYRIVDANTTSFAGTLAAADKGVILGNTSVIDTINIRSSWSNRLEDVVYNDINGASRIGKTIGFALGTPVDADYNTFGILAQDVIEFNKYLKIALGLRYSEINTINANNNNSQRRSAWNPSAGFIVTPIQHFNVFGSYTNSSSLRSAANRMVGGGEIGASTTEQFETGIKSDWLNEKLRFNLTYFHIYTSNLSNQEYVEGTTTPTGYYFKAGDLVRDGIEAELNGRILDNLTVMLGYAYLDARYKNSPSYVDGSEPMNAPDHTANGWVQYVFNQGALKNFSLSAGVYYVGKRPVNEFSNAYDGHTYNPGVEPFDMPAYTTLNAQLGYKAKKWEARLFLNNLTDEVGLNSYFRGGFINQIDPRNVAFALNYKF